MPIDYSKWDNLELSDDSDVECHPNIEKGTFIRLRQQKIRRDRQERKEKRRLLQSEIQLNSELVDRIRDIRSQLSKDGGANFAPTLHQWKDEIENAKVDLERRLKQREEKSQQQAYQSWKHLQDLSEDEDENTDESEERAAEDAPTQDQMVAALFARIIGDIAKNRELAWDPSSDKARDAFTEELDGHVKKLEERISSARKDLEEVIKEDARHLTVDDVMHEGFNHTIVNKSTTNEDGKRIQKSKVHSVELLNPDRPTHRDLSREAQDIAAEPNSDQHKDVREGKEDEIVYSDYNQDEYADLELAKDSKQFAELKTIEEAKNYIMDNPSIISEQKSDQILAAAFDLQLKGHGKKAKQYVRQSLIISYIHTMGPGGPRVFFDRVLAPGTKGHTMFYNDVDSRYEHIVERCKVIAAEREKAGESGDQEVIQLEGNNPSAYQGWDLPEEGNPEHAERLAVFHEIPEEMQKALRVGTLDAVNKVLANMGMSEAEEVLAKCSDAGFLTAAYIDESAAVNAAATATEQAEIDAAASIGAEQQTPTDHNQPVVTADDDQVDNSSKQ
ncbi:hsp90 co-chaperone Cdc37 [Spiromyces aspiralis]|uniref:Hsp90 co-chaperone Cdc37 n=1 Tax=Spiromyces aspiralis TaxID=68401 RepID=A0ACC1HPP1_9FUNG|nr:hsp90 co-chaperone Cdc37 [Spiromyces aspiralis]